jgi:hypothetical protein
VGLNSLKSLNLTNGYPNKNNNNNNNNKNNKVKSKPLELFELTGKKEVFVGGNFWPQISSNLGQKDGTLFAPNFAPSMQNRNSLTPPHICTA